MSLATVLLFLARVACTVVVTVLWSTLSVVTVFWVHLWQILGHIGAIVGHLWAIVGHVLAIPGKVGTKFARALADRVRGRGSQNKTHRQDVAAGRKHVAFEDWKVPSSCKLNDDKPDKRDAWRSALNLVWSVSVTKLLSGTSMERRLQTLAAASFSLHLYIPLLILSFTTFFILLIFPLTTLLMIAYFCSMKWGKDPVSGRRSPWLRGAKWWQRFSDFFPVMVVKTAPLPADGRYVIGYHPHGIISVGAFAAFCTEGVHTVDLTPQDGGTGSEGPKRGWAALFPGVDRRLITLPLNFMVPFLREYFLALGLLSSSRESFRNVLSTPGHAVAVVVGGAEEAQMSEKRTIQLVLNKRKGFVREALLAGASLVPTVAFGENDLYMTTSFAAGHPVQRLQEFVLRNFGVSLPIFRGRGIFCKDDFGLLPTRHPVTIIVGEPIAVPTVDAANFEPMWRKSGEPANDDAMVVDEMHRRYIFELRRLSSKYKRADWNLPGQEMLEYENTLEIKK